MRATRTLVVVVAAVAAVLGPLGVRAGAAPPDRADALQVFNRDVYVVVGQSLRNPTADTPADAPLFNVAGVALDLTWGEWSSATATSTAHATGKRTDVRMQLAGLVPGGLYSIFWGTLQPDSEHPGCPDVERTLPLDAFHADASAPAPNAFVAGPDGTAEFRGRTGTALLEAVQVFFSVVYHAYGETSYPFPNRGELLTQGENCRSTFGEDSMRQLTVLQKW
jgi:hypothetical protein